MDSTASSSTAGVPQNCSGGPTAVDGWPVIDPGVAHDIRGLLSTILLQAEALMARGVEDPCLARLCHAAEQTIGICESALDPRRTSAVRRVHLRPVVDDVIAVLTAGLYPPDLFRNAVCPGMAAMAEPATLHRALFNLLRNAAAAAGAKGLVAVEGGTAAGRSVILIQDSGTGLNRAAIQSLFQSFATSSTGYGLGLATARDLLRTLAGDLQLVTTGPEGTRFAAVLPAARPEATDPIAAGERRLPAAGWLGTLLSTRPTLAVG